MRLVKNIRAKKIEKKVLKQQLNILEKENIDIDDPKNFIIDFKPIIQRVVKQTIQEVNR